MPVIACNGNNSALQPLLTQRQRTAIRTKGLKANQGMKMQSLDIEKQQSIQAIGELLADSIHFKSIDKDLRQIRFLDLSNDTRPCKHGCCEWSELRKRDKGLRRSRGFLRASPESIDTELLTSLPYIHGMLMNLPYQSIQARMLKMSPHSVCDSLNTIRISENPSQKVVVVNLEETVSLRNLNTGKKVTLDQKKVKVLEHDDLYEIVNPNDQSIRLIALLVDTQSLTH